MLEIQSFINLVRTRPSAIQTPVCRRERTHDLCVCVGGGGVRGVGSCVYMCLCLGMYVCVHVCLLYVCVGVKVLFDLICKPHTFT